MRRYDNPSSALEMEVNEDGEFIEHDEFIPLLNKMFDAEEKFGVGFYSDEEWTKYYDELRRLLGRKNRFKHLGKEGQS